jgi:hypothetical protein
MAISPGFVRETKGNDRDPASWRWAQGDLRFADAARIYVATAIGEVAGADAPTWSSSGLRCGRCVRSVGGRRSRRRPLAARPLP